MSTVRLLLVTSLAMLAFAGNSLLNRAGLLQHDIDPISFAAIRLLSGVLMLWLLVAWRSRRTPPRPDWRAAVALFAYLAGFSLAYLDLSAAMGALLLFGAVQVTMMAAGLLAGERLRLPAALGMLAALAGMLVLLLPGASAPALLPAGWMLLAGIAWGLYSLRGRTASDALAQTAVNFLCALPLMVPLLLWRWPLLQLDGMGTFYALLSGALTSAIGYALWYSVVPQLGATRAATVQLSVPLITAAGGVVLLGEAIHWRLLVAMPLVLGGIALVLRQR